MGAQKFLIRWGTGLFVFSFAFSVWAGDVQFDLTSLGQVRENSRSQREIPVNGFAGMQSSFEKWNFSTFANGRVMRDFEQNLDEADLYQGYFHLQPMEALQFDVGRQFVSQGFFASVLDGAQITVAPWEHVDFIAYSGVPRSVEIGDFNTNDGLLTGLSIALTNFSRTAVSVHGAWRKNNILIDNLTQNDEVRVGGNFSHQFAISSTPLFYGMAEYDVTGEILETGTAGFDIYPGRRLSFNGEFQYFNIGREQTRQTIQRLFTGGRLIGGRVAPTLTLVPRALDWFASYGYQSAEIRDGDQRNSHILESGFRWTLAAVNLETEAAYYYSRSFGGHVHGGRLTLMEQFTEKFYADLTGDFSQYRKITNDNDIAFSGVIWTGYEILKDFLVSGGFEYNKNDFFNNEYRGSFRIDYHFGFKS